MALCRGIGILRGWMRRHVLQPLTARLPLPLASCSDLRIFLAPYLAAAAQCSYSAIMASQTTFYFRLGGSREPYVGEGERMLGCACAGECGLQSALVWAVGVSGGLLWVAPMPGNLAFGVEGLTFESHSSGPQKWFSFPFRLVVRTMCCKSQTGRVDSRLADVARWHAMSSDEQFL